MKQLIGPTPPAVEQLNLVKNRLEEKVPETLCNLANQAGHLDNLCLLFPSCMVSYVKKNLHKIDLYVKTGLKLDGSARN
jgi:hypothetical protein